jgi:opacity protein-like surface antigen
MKITYLIIASLTIGLSAFAGPQSIEPEPGPAPPIETYFKDGFSIGLSGVGNWTQSEFKTDRYFGVDHAFGGTIDLKYFLKEYYGIGVRFSGYNVRNPSGPAINGERKFVGDLLPTLTFRYPMGKFAPYVFVGAGTLFNGGNKGFKIPNVSIGGKIDAVEGDRDAKMMAEGGLGVEYRLTPSWSVNLEGVFDKPMRPNSNSYGLRAGLGFNF